MNMKSGADGRVEIKYVELQLKVASLSASGDRVLALRHEYNARFEARNICNTYWIDLKIMGYYIITLYNKLLTHVIIMIIEKIQKK